jgi:hypothetical protein
MSNNIVPFVTKITASRGVKVTSFIDEDYVENVSVEVDSDFLKAAIANAGLGGTLTPTQRANLAKISEIYEAMGLDASGNEPSHVADSDSDNISIVYQQRTSTLTENFVLRFSIVTNTNDTAVEKIVTFGVGTPKDQVLPHLRRVILRNQLAVKYLRKLYQPDIATINVGWKPTYEKFQFRFRIISASQLDGVSISFLSKK